MDQTPVRAPGSTAPLIDLLISILGRFDWLRLTRLQVTSYVSGLR